MLKKIKFLEKSELSASELADWEHLWLQSKDRNFFNSPIWFSSFVASFDFPVKIFLGYQDEKLFSVLALFRIRRFKLLSCWSDADLDFRLLDKSSWLVSDGVGRVELETFYQKIKQSVSCLSLKDLSSQQQEIFQKLEPKAIFNFNNVSLFGKIDCDCLRVMPGKQRRNMLSRIRKNKKRLHFEFLPNDKLQQGLQEVVQIEKASHKKEKGMILFDSRVKNFFENLISKNKNFLKIGILTIDGEPAASILGFNWGKTFLSYHLTFADKFRSLGAGKMAIYFALEELGREGFEVFDFSKGDSYLKRQFVDQVENHWDFFYSKNLLKRFIWRNFLMIKKIKRKLKSRKN